MAHIQVFGFGEIIGFAAITPEVASALRQPALTQTDFENIREDLNFEWRSGLAGEGTVEVDGEVQSVSIPDSSSSPIEATERLAKPGEHYLLIVETAKGYWLDMEVPGDFDPTKLVVEINEYVLANDNRVRFSELSYDGDSEIGESTGKGDYYYVTFPDGVSHEIATADWD